MIRFTVTTPEGPVPVVVDPTDPLGRLSADEFKIATGYVVASGLPTEEAWAGAGLLVLIYRALKHRDVDVEIPDLVEAACA